MIDGCGGAYRPGDATGLNSPGENFFERSNPVVIAPNPSTGIFNITSNREGEVALEVLDMFGRSVRKFTLKDKASYQLDLSGHTKGIYLLRMNSEGKMQTQKMVLQ
ncbi:MAG: T9SS type A sorting domain-containing protein [Taibaiella sp.]